MLRLSTGHLSIVGGFDDGMPSSSRSPSVGCCPPLSAPQPAVPRERYRVAPPADQIAGGVSIADFAFQPMVAVVGVGCTATWTNTGAAPHTITSDMPAFDSGILNLVGDFSMTLTAPGTYAYHCAIHPSMVGTIQVS